MNESSALCGLEFRSSFIHLSLHTQNSATTIAGSGNILSYNSAGGVTSCVTFSGIIFSKNAINFSEDLNLFLKLTVTWLKKARTFIYDSIPLECKR